MKGRTYPAKTIGALADAYRQSPRWKGWAPETRKQADRIVAELVRKHGEKPVAKVTRGTLQQAVDTIAARDGYGAGLRWLGVVSGLLAYATRIDWLGSNPARDVERPRPPDREGLRTWREDEIDAFLAAYPLGTTPHLALTLILYTGASVADACALGPMNLRGGRIEYRRSKTKGRGGPLIAVPVAAPLADALALVPRERMTYLETRRGTARDPHGLSREFGRWLDRIGMDAPDENGRRLRSHGLRKAMGRRLAEAGCTPSQIMAILGHQSLAEAARYTRAYDRRSAADEAMDRLANARSESPVIHRLKR